MIYLFVVDTSASMNQKAPNGMTLLDSAKSAIEYFVTLRSRDPMFKRDKFLLVTCEEGLGGIKVGWKDTMDTFNHEVKNLKALDLTDIGTALKKAFDLLNINRFQYNVDAYGQGRMPWLIDPATIILFSDGGYPNDKTSVYHTLTLPLAQPLPGSELTKEPFRWDQKLYGVVLRFGVFSTTTYLTTMCDVTGGRCWVPNSLKQVLSVMENIANKTSSMNQFSVSLCFDPYTSTKPVKQVVAPSCRGKHIYIPSSNGNWPIPEELTINSQSISIPPRTAQPQIKYRPIASAMPQIPSDFPVDIYTMEVSPLTAYILSMSAGQKVVFDCFIVQSDPTPVPFGFLRAINETTVALYVMPYNYSYFLGLLNNYLVSQTPKWKADWEKYVASIPPYYLPFLKQAMKRWNPPIPQGTIHLPPAPYTLIPESVNYTLPHIISNQMKEIKKKLASELENIETGLVALKKYEQKKPQMQVSRQNLLELANKLLVKKERTQHIAVSNAEHSVPISQMGDYLAYLQKEKPLRSVDETHEDKIFFGNPFSKNKKVAGFVDEADAGAAMDGGYASNGSSPQRKRNKRTQRRSGESASKRQKREESSVSSTESSPSSSPQPSPPQSPRDDMEVDSVSESEMEVAEAKMETEFKKDLSTSQEMAKQYTALEKLEFIAKNNTLKLKCVAYLHQPTLICMEQLQKLVKQLVGPMDIKHLFVQDLMDYAKLFKKQLVLDKLIDK